MRGSWCPPFCFVSYPNGSTFRIDTKKSTHVFGFPPLDYSLYLVQLPSFGFSAGSTWNILSCALSAILDSLFLRRKPHATAQAQMFVISGHGIINIFKILIDFGWYFSDKGALPGGPF